MNEKEVTLSFKSEGLLAGVVFSVLAVVFGVIAWTDKELIGVFVMIAAIMCSGYFFFYASCQQKLDAEGIHIKTCFGQTHYPWELVEKTRIIRTSSKDLSHIQFFIRGRKRTVLVYYTKRTLECLRYYHGEPDEDRVKKPPSVF